MESAPASVCVEQTYAAEFTSERVGSGLLVCHPSGCFSVSLWTFFPPHSHLVCALISDAEAEALGRWKRKCVSLHTCSDLAHVAARPPGPQWRLWRVSVQVRKRSGRKPHADVLPLRSGWDVVEGKKGEGPAGSGPGGAAVVAMAVTLV